MDIKEMATQASHRHPWETARCQFFVGQLHEALDAADLPEGMLDVGSGDAWFAAQVSAALRLQQSVSCWDNAYSNPRVKQEVAREAGALDLVVEAPERAFGLITMMDVLEHVADDAAFLGAIVTTNLAPGGYLLASVPAWMPLYSLHDKFLGHHRRYSPGQGADLLRSAGLRIVRQGGLFHSLLAPRALQVMRERWLSADADATLGVGGWQHGDLLTRLVGLGLGLDTKISAWLAERNYDVPGLTWWALCRKAAQSA